RALHRVPEGYATLIGNSTVDIMPTEIAELYYYKMNYCARPIPQTYSAYDEYLDAKNAEKLTSDSGPEYLLYTNEAIDHRHPFWDESITKRAMLSHYELIAKDSMLDIATRFNEDRYLYLNPDVKASVETGVFKNGYEHYLRFGREESRQIISPGTTVFLLFKKRKTPLAMKVKKERSAIVKIGEELNISKTDHLQYLYADIQYNFLGKIQRLLFQPPQIDVIVKYEDGSTQRYQAIVPIMKTGVLINKKVDSKNDAIVFFMYQAGRNQNISSIRFEASNGFDGSIRATIKEILFE
ncbi:MAG TPA: hypothetical protein VHM20_04635, partial [Gammaproteobacteria bacterium]|nr:hypothetical protein [Gammaproteobacteria bacterium]